MTELELVLSGERSVYSLTREQTLDLLLKALEAMAASKDGEGQQPVMVMLQPQSRPDQSPSA